MSRLAAIRATMFRSSTHFTFGLLMLLMLLVLMPLEILSGGMMPRESMPDLVRRIMFAAPTTHFVALARTILDRGADFAIVWPQFVALLVIGAALFGASLAWFRRSLARMA